MNNSHFNPKCNKENFFQSSMDDKKSIPPRPAPIIDGDLAGEDEFKFIATIERENEWPHGAGIIIDKYWILTARHVIIDQFSDDTSFYFNFSDIGSLIVRPKYSNDQRVSIEKPFYKPEKLFCHHVPNDQTVFYSDSDVGLIKLQVPLQLGIDPYNIDKIDFYHDDMDMNMDHGYNISVAGWGRIAPNESKIVYKLRKAEISNLDRIQDWNFDFSEYPSFRPFQQISLRFPGHNPCVGDSGGPAVVTEIETRKEHLFGIISWGSKPLCK